MAAHEKSALTLVVSIFISIVVVVVAITMFVPAEDLILYAYVGSVVGVLVALYELPAVVAYNKNHPQCLAILLLNILSGWTIVGWVVALVWAFASTTPIAMVPTRVSQILPVRTRLTSSLSFQYQRVFVSKQHA